MRFIIFERDVLRSFSYTYQNCWRWMDTIYRFHNFYRYPKGTKKCLIIMEKKIYIYIYTTNVSKMTITFCHISSLHTYSPVSLGNKNSVLGEIHSDTHTHKVLTLSTWTEFIIAKRKNIKDTKKSLSWSRFIHHDCIIS